MYNSIPIGTVSAFAGQADPVTASKNQIWSNTDCQAGPDQAVNLNPNVPLNHLESQGWMLCDGRFLSCTVYPELFAVLGFLYGKSTSPDGPSFRIPDYRGLFLRGVNAGSGMDPQASERKSADGSNSKDNGVGSLQCDAFQTHDHNYNAYNQPIPAGNTGSAASTISIAQKTTSPNAPARTASETRPKNVAVNYIIKFR